MKVNTVEDRLLADLKRLVDRTSEQLQWGNLTVWEACERIRKTRAQAEALIDTGSDGVVSAHLWGAISTAA